MVVQISFEILSSLVATVGAFIAYREFKKNKNLNAIDKFISYREKLKKDNSLSKIVKHIQLWQNNDELKNQIPIEITLFDFYNFIGYYEEIYILITKSHLDKEIAKDMFAFYAIEIADNHHYWRYFNENYRDDVNWQNFSRFIALMR